MSSDSSSSKSKKARRSIRADTNSSKSEGSESKKSKVEKPIVPVNETQGQEISLFYAEEEEVSKRDPQNDLRIHQVACKEIRAAMKSILQAKESGDVIASADIPENRIHGSLQFLTLKKLNRLAHLRCKKVRDETSNAKQKIDNYHLQLQNLLYEVMHLQKEITKCLEFKSKDEEVDLVSEEEFYTKAPEDISKPEITSKDEHQKMKARLVWELEERKELAEKLKKSESSKDEILSNIKTKKEYLDSLQPKLSTILQSTKPVQQYLGMNFDEIREQHRTAVHLPEPLYVLYMQASAYQEACDKNLTVSIEGDLEAAISIETEQHSDVEDDSDSDQEEDTHKKKSKHRRRTIGDHLSHKRQKALKKHPLSVVFVVKCKDGSSVQMSFYHLLTLNIVTMTMKLARASGSSYSTISGGDLLSSDMLLSCLYPGDHGNDTPNPSNRYTLRSLGMADFTSYISELGHPYLWCQWLAGLQFMGGAEVTKAQALLSASHMGETIQKIRKRIRARLALQKQLASLEQGSVVVSSQCMKLFPSKISSRLSSWKRSTYEDFKTLPYTAELVGSNQADEKDMFFIANITRGSATLKAQIAISSDYPNKSPLIAVAIFWRGSEKTALTDTHIRDLECEVNIHHTDLLASGSHDQILTKQIQRLMMCFDVYLETECMGADLEGPTEFPVEKMFPRNARGPLRSKPYKFNHQLGYFCQR